MLATQQLVNIAAIQWQKHMTRGYTFVFCIMRCLGDRIRATNDVEKSISMIDTLPSSLLKILENGSVWKILNPLDVPVRVARVSQIRTQADKREGVARYLTDS